MRKAAGLMVVLIWSGLAGQASAEPVPKGHQPFLDRMEASIAPVRACRGETVVLPVHLDLKDRAHAYPTQDPDSEIGQAVEPCRVEGPDSAVVVPVDRRRAHLPHGGGSRSVAIASLRVATWERAGGFLPTLSRVSTKIAVNVIGQIVNDHM